MADWTKAAGPSKQPAGSVYEVKSGTELKPE